MSSSFFRVDEHVLPCQHIRGYPRATANEQEEVLHLAIKQYTPLSNLNPKPGDITIIGAHANGFPKELYEPLWDDILQRTEQYGFSIRGIWIADVAQQGSSGVLNEGKLGNDPSWFDHPRDLLLMVNHFRSQMPRPIIGIGHSMGGHNLVNVSLMHPRLIETLILIDPVIQRFSSALGNYAPAQASAFRRDRWPSRAAAIEAFKRNKFYQAWDPRVLECWNQHGLRELPTLLYPSPPPTPSSTYPAVITTEPTLTPTPPKPEVTLTTTKHQEVLTFLRPNFPPPQPKSSTTQTSHEFTTSRPVFNRNTHPDLSPLENPQTPFYRPEPIITFHQLPHLRPSVLYIFGSLSYLSSPELRADKLIMTGTGVGGSGGANEGRVKEVLLEDVGHLIPMERVGETAENVAQWVGAEMDRWRAVERLTEDEWEGKKGVQRAMMGERYLELMASGMLHSAKRKLPAEKL
ncbi:toxin biosynthesis protein-like protein [Lepidopterella palustris CBS 459.81]|uniref:Toxin biosynthesis protein-like protein n=1 Tax=Lepidopterella palustris CBS 459.81 TaxID=1314670 RepID=A0A8E2E7X1_9PEZI|nr:toxin biosynthesis protein-like protein [Lepidopterella palustris CBS 459.81]